MARRPQLCIVLVLLGCLFSSAELDEKQFLKIYVYNKAEVPDRVLAEAEVRASRIFRSSGLQANWVNCAIASASGTDCTGLPESGDVIVQIVPETRKLKGDVFGAAFLGEGGIGQYTDVYYNRVIALNRDWKVSMADVLGHVIAHEVGHILLGLNSHSASGIMRGYWESSELRAAERGRLRFSADQSMLMRERLAGVRTLRDTRNTVAAASGN